VEQYNSNELLQIIGNLYTDLYRTRFVMQQYQQQLQEKDKQVADLQSELKQSKVTLSEFKSIVEKQGGSDKN